MKGLIIDGKAIDEYVQDSSTGENYMQIEPVSGMMTKMVRSYTMVYSNSCFQNDHCSQYSQLPFPGLDNYKNKQIPIYMVREEINIDPQELQDSVGYIARNHERIYSWSLAMCLVSFLCLLLALCFQCLWWMNTPVEQPVNYRVKRIEEAEDQQEIADESFNQAFF